MHSVALEVLVNLNQPGAVLQLANQAALQQHQGDQSCLPCCCCCCCCCCMSHAACAAVACRPHAAPHLMYHHSCCRSVMQQMLATAQAMLEASLAVMMS